MEENIFKKRSGCTDKGKNYEDLIVGSLILKLIQSSCVEDFNVSSNNDRFGVFDDVVLETTSVQVTRTYAIQLKHSSTKGKVLTKNALTEKRGNFSIQKYFEDFKNLRNFDKHINFILFTNLKFDVPDGEKIRLKDESVEVTIEKASVENLLNTSAEGCCYRFRSDNRDFQSFFENFSLYTNQANMETVKEETSQQFEEMFASNNNIFRNYCFFINEWNMKEGRKPKLGKEFMEKILTLCVLSPSIVPLSFECSVNDKTKIFRQAIEGFNITVFEPVKMEKVKRIYSDAKNHLHDIGKINKLALQYQIISNNIEDIDVLSDLDKTKLLWLLEKCPLLVEESESLQKVIDLCGNQKFIILTQFASRNSFQKLSDLNPQSDLFGKILTNFECSVQGKEICTLSTIVKQDQKFLFIFTTNELLEMLDGPSIIGGIREELSEPYINRFLSRNFIRFKYLEQLAKNTLIVVSCHQQFEEIKSQLTDFVIIKSEEYLKKTEEDWVDIVNLHSTEINRKVIFISENRCCNSDFEEICRRNPMKEICHHFGVVKGNLEWIRSIGGILDLEEHIIDGAFIEEYQFSQNIGNKVEVICADSGMGKSMLMKNIKNSLLPTTLAILIYVKEHSIYFRQKNYDIGDFLQYALYKINKHHQPFELKYLKILNSNHQTVFIWDGLDEISDENLDTVIKIINELGREKFPQLVTSRNNLKTVLENEFSVFARTIKPFGKEEQDNYIKKRINVEDDDRILMRIKINISLIRGSDFFGIPLQIFMMTELFRQNSQKCNELFDRIFTLADLYYHFVDEKFNVYYRDKANLDFSNDVVNKMMSICKKVTLENYEKAALKLLFSNMELFNGLDTDCDEFLDEIQEKSDSFGFITELSSERLPNFIHNSYAEYFAAQYFLKHYKQIPNFNKIIYKKPNITMWFLFDLLTIKDSPAHVAVMYKNVSVLLNCKREEIINCKDLVGRNLFQLACMYSQRYVPVKIRKSGLFGKRYSIWEDTKNLVKRESNKNILILDYLVKICKPFEKDDLFKLNSFEYCMKFRSLYPLIQLSKTYNKSIDLDIASVISILYYAIKFDYADSFDSANISELPFIETVDEGHSILHLAAKYNSVKCMKKILQNDFYSTKINDGDNNGHSPVNIACNNKHIEIVRLLIENNANFNTPSEDGDTPLCIVSRKGYIDIAQMLIFFKANVSAANKFGTTPIYEACSNGHSDVVKLLISEKVDINSVNNKGYFPLHVACYHKHTEIVKLLLDNGARVNNADINGTTAFHVACFRGYIDIINILREEGADIGAMNNNGFTAIFMASEKGHVEVVQYLIDCNIDINAKGKDGFTALHLACQNNQIDVARLLIRHKVDIDAENDNGATPLFVAAQHGFCEVVRLLIGASANVNVANKDGLTPLYMACHNGFIDIVRLLIDAKVLFIVKKTKNGYSPLQAAQQRGHFEIVQLLINYRSELKQQEMDLIRNF